MKYEQPTTNNSTWLNAMMLNINKKKRNIISNYHNERKAMFVCKKSG